MRRSIFHYIKESLDEKIVSVDPVPDGKKFIEKEYVLYAKIENADILKSASNSIEQEQWEVKIPKVFENASGGRIRIRKTVKENNVSYIQTTKTKVDTGEMEVELLTTEDAFNQFKLLATSGMYKTRYFFPIENTNLKWEVDVFTLENGEQSRWVKIDLEVTDDTNIIPELPAGFSHVIKNQKSKQTDEEKKIIRDLYSRVFLRKNENITDTKTNTYASLIKI
jgi:CYTH domain-containing protein